LEVWRRGKRRGGKRRDCCGEEATVRRQPRELRVCQRLRNQDQGDGYTGQDVGQTEPTSYESPPGGTTRVRELCQLTMTLRITAPLVRARIASFTSSNGIVSETSALRLRSPRSARSTILGMSLSTLAPP